jgi:transcriptional regulator with XRE-family HTH domain
MKTVRRTELGRTIRRARTSKGLSTPALAAAIGATHSTITRLENGEHKSVSPQRLARLGDALGIDLFEQAIYPNLPQFTPYMRARYKDLSPQGIAAIAAYAERIAKKRGTSILRPTNREDE